MAFFTYSPPDLSESFQQAFAAYRDVALNQTWLFEYTSDAFPYPNRDSRWRKWFFGFNSGRSYGSAHCPLSNISASFRMCLEVTYRDRGWSGKSEAGDYLDGDLLDEDLHSTTYTFLETPEPHDIRKAIISLITPVHTNTTSRRRLLLSYNHRQHKHRPQLRQKNTHNRSPIFRAWSFCSHPWKLVDLKHENSFLQIGGIRFRAEGDNLLTTLEIMVLYTNRGARKSGWQFSSWGPAHFGTKRNSDLLDRLACTINGLDYQVAYVEPYMDILNVVAFHLTSPTEVADLMRAKQFQLLLDHSIVGRIIDADVCAEDVPTRPPFAYLCSHQATRSFSLPRVKEWVSYHQLLGFDTIHLYDRTGKYSSIASKGQTGSNVRVRVTNYSLAFGDELPAGREDGNNLGCVSAEASNNMCGIAQDQFLVIHDCLWHAQAARATFLFFLDLDEFIGLGPNFKAADVGAGKGEVNYGHDLRAFLADWKEGEGNGVPVVKLEQALFPTPKEKFSQPVISTITKKLVGDKSHTDHSKVFVQPATISWMDIHNAGYARSGREIGVDEIRDMDEVLLHFNHYRQPRAEISTAGAVIKEDKNSAAWAAELVR